MKKILFLNYEFPPLGGGAANANKYLFNEFKKRKDLKIDLITSSISGFKEENFSDNINIFYLDIGKKSNNANYQSNIDLLKYSFKAYFFAKKKMKGEKYDLIHAFFGIPCGYLAMKLNLPYIVSLRGSDVPFYNKRFAKLDKYIFKRLSKKIWRNSKFTVANSKGLKELALRSSYNQDIKVIENGVDVDKFQKIRKIENDKFTILYVGRLIERKGVDILLKAFKEINKNDDCRLVIAGDGNLKDDLEKLREDLDLKDSVIFRGKVEHDELPKVYRSADLYVLPSYNEGMSNTLLEAIASNLPVVVTDTGGSKELLYQNGIVIRKGSKEDLIDAILKIKNNPELKDQFSKKSSEIAENKKWAKVAEKYIELYNKI